MKKVLALSAMVGMLATPALADLITDSGALQVSTSPYAGDVSRLLQDRVPVSESRALTGNAYDARFLGQSTGGGAGFLEDGSGLGTTFYDGALSTVGTSLLPGADLLSVQEFEVVNPVSQPLASLQVQIELSTSGLDLLPSGFQFSPTQPIDLLRFDSGAFGAGTNPIDPANGTFDVIDAFMVGLDSGGGVVAGPFNMVNGVVAGTLGVSTLFDASIFPGDGLGITSIIQVWNITPEPATIAMLGLGGLVMLRRRR
jgi:hypothetical protein